jgi:methyltransferase family protein
MSGKPNDQYNLAAPDSMAVKVGLRVRERMFATFMSQFAPACDETVLDIGATSDQDYSASNYFERLYPYKERITASGLGDASFLQQQYPGLNYVCANALDLPFADASFDLVHSSAVLEHVGSFENQTRMVGECVRVARRGICLTTPNRWFPIEIHTQLPLLHWLPSVVYRRLFHKMGYDYFAEEANLNLMSTASLLRTTAGIPGWRFQVVPARLLGWTSNLMLFAQRI